MEYEFVEDPAEELTCSICMKVLCEPHLVNCCGQQFCKDCLERWLQKNTTCPHCRSAGFSHMLMQPTSRKTRELKVYCPNHQHGCKAVLKMSECEEHLSTTNDRGCAYVRLKCPNACTAELFRGEMDAHTLMECPKRTVVCLHCYFIGEHQYIGDHENECPLYPLPCPLGCEDTVLRKDLEAHRDTCPLEPVSCPLHELGCKTTVCRKDLEKHVETSTSKHMTVLAKSLTALQVEHTALQAECTALNAGHATLKAEHIALQAECTTLNAGHATLKAEHIALQAECTTLNARHAEEHIALQAKCTALNAGHAALKEEHIALQAEYTTLRVEHSALKAQHIALKAEHTALEKSYSAKMEAIGRVGFSYDSSDSLQLAQIHTILADSSYVKFGDTVCLALSESNEKSGQHHFILSQEALPELQFKLEWEMKLAAQKSLVFKLYSTILLVTPASCFGVEIRFILWGEPKVYIPWTSFVTVCRSKPGLNARDGLLAMLSLGGQNSKQIGIRFKQVNHYHHPRPPPG